MEQRPRWFLHQLPAGVLRAQRGGHRVHESNATVDSTLSIFQGGGLPALRSWAALSGSGATTSYAQPTVTSVSGAGLMSTSGSVGGCLLFRSTFQLFFCQVLDPDFSKV
jgi:hypothetical protein